MGRPRLSPRMGRSRAVSACGPTTACPPRSALRWCTALHKTWPELCPDGLYIQLEDCADRGEGEAVLRIGPKPLPRLACSSLNGSAVAPVARGPFALEAPKGIFEDSLAQAA